MKFKIAFAITFLMMLPTLLFSQTSTHWRRTNAPIATSDMAKNTTVTVTTTTTVTPTPVNKKDFSNQNTDTSPTITTTTTTQTVSATSTQADSINITIIGIGGASSVQGLNQSTAGVSFGIRLLFGDHYKIKKITSDTKKGNSPKDATKNKKVTSIISNGPNNDNDDYENNTESSFIPEDANNNNNKVDGGYRFYQRNMFYFLFNPVPATSNDSNSIAKTFLFPEISKKDFVIGYERIFPFIRGRNLTPDNNNFRNTTFSCFTEFSTSHYDTGVNSFRTWVGMIGMKLNFNGGIGTLNFGFQIIPYYSLISVEQKYFNAMDNDLLGKSTATLDTLKSNINGISVLTNKGLPPTIHSFGLEVKASLSSFEIFANFKYILNNQQININPNVINPDLKNTVFTIGVLISPDIWSFNIQKN